MPNLGLGYGQHIMCYFKLVWPREKKIGHLKFTTRTTIIYIYIEAAKRLGRAPWP